MKRIVIIGGGFAGIWSAIGAARKLHELKIDEKEVEVMLINRDGYLGIRPRFYEKDPQNTRIALSQVLDPVGVKQMEGEVKNIDTKLQIVTVHQNEKQLDIPYDRLVIATGSQLVRPNVPGLREHAFSVDTYQDAIDLDKHIHALPNSPNVEGKYTAVIVGAGFTGIEIATEMVSRLKEIASKESKEAEVRVFLVDRNADVGAELGANPRPIIQNALADMNVTFYSKETVTSFDAEGVFLQSGERIPAQTAIWTAGVMATPLTELLPAEKDRLGRLHVDAYLRVKGLPTVFAAGDTALAKTDEDHHALMSCQHAIPMGKFAGHNVVCDLLNNTGMPYRQEDYATCLDLGPWGALVTNGWDRVPQQQGEEAKKTKQYINQDLIYPPLSGNREELFDAARPGEISQVN